MKHFLAIAFVLVSLKLSAQSWEKIQTGFNYILMGIEFPENQSQIGFAAGESLTYMGDGIVIKTTDGGNTWSSLWTGTDQGIEGVSFPDLNTGYVAGWSEYCAKTTNGGVSWTTLTPGTDIYYYTDVVFKDAQHGIITASLNVGGGAVYVTSDGGNTWTVATGLACIPAGACYVTDNTYYVVGNGLVQRSTDGGLTWTTIKSGLGLLLGIDFYNPMVGIACSEDGWLHKTYDGGVTWQSQQIAFGQPLWHDVAWSSASDVTICGTPEFIYKSTDGGATWSDDFPASSYDPALYEAIYTTDGTGYICGSQGWFYRKASSLNAAFTASNSKVCEGGNVQFTDLSSGNPTGWEWTFEGGNPATSTEQNPVVTYPTTGIYDVTLVVHKGAASNSNTQPDMITVETPLTVIASQPSGNNQVCGLSVNSYSTTALPGVSEYVWTTNPVTAGVFTGNGTTSSLTVSNVWSGDFMVHVSASNSCGNGPLSEGFAVNSHFQPVSYSLYSGGGYCEGTAGYEVRLADSDIPATYQLYKNGAACGTPVAGTGQMLGFGLQPEGNYTISAVSGTCTADMQGVASNFIITLPSAALTPSGPTEMCSGTQTTYQGSLPANGYTLFWELNPATAGIISQPTLTTAVINWDSNFSGAALLSVAGQNECGNGSASPPLIISVNGLPAPAVSGNNSTCVDKHDAYTTLYTSGSTYNWIVTGGEIITGQGTATIDVLWNTIGTGSVVVTETSVSDCEVTSAAYTVEVSACSDVAAEKITQLIVFPNPASDRIHLVLPASFVEGCNISIISSDGRCVANYVNFKSGSEGWIDITDIKSGIYNLVITSNAVLAGASFIKK